jgi:hypothetical protein
MDDIGELIRQMTAAMERLNDAHKVTPGFPPYQFTDSWKTYVARLDQHYYAHSVPNDKKKSCFLAWAGNEIYELTKKLYADKDLDTATYTEIIASLSIHFESTTHELAARHKFWKSVMKSRQTYADWVADLRGLATECNFVCSKEGCGQRYVDSLIQDVIVVNAPHDQVRAAALQRKSPH